MKNLSVLGIMSGTSIDSVDYALCRVSRGTIKLEDQWQVRFPAVLQMQLHRAARGETNSHELAQLHHDLGRFYAVSALHGRRKPQLVGLHGQTIFHQPSKGQPATLQIGEPAYLAETLRVPVVNNFRAGDMAAGGQGAPLATLVHRLLFAQRGIHVCVNNLGGISNVTSLDWREGKQPAVLAFDTGPANVLLDLAVKHYTRGELKFDRDGHWAAQGRSHELSVQLWLEHPFFAQKPPKSTGREMFGERFLESILPEVRRARLSPYDTLASLTEFTALSIARSYQQHLPGWPQTVILCGGGAANAHLVKRIEAHLQEMAPDIYVGTSENFGWPLQSLEPAAFAYLAYLRWFKRPSNLPGTTGASRALSLGQVTEP